MKRLHTYPPRERMRAQGRSFSSIGVRNSRQCRDKKICFFLCITASAVQLCARKTRAELSRWDGAPLVGVYTSLALGSADGPHISYHDWTSGAMASRGQ